MKRAFFASFVVAVLAALFATQAFGAQRGGTLKGMFATDVDFIDPSLAYYQHSWQVMGATGANLLRFADAEGSAGSRLVPEVATGFPAVSKDGKTYTFTLRNTFKFSNGKRVTAANFAWAINRALSSQQQSPAGPFVADVVGAQAVLDGKARAASGVRVLGPNRLQTGGEDGGADVVGGRRSGEGGGERLQPACDVPGMCRLVEEPRALQGLGAQRDDRLGERPVVLAELTGVVEERDEEPTADADRERQRAERAPRRVREDLPEKRELPFRVVAVGEPHRRP